MKVTFVGTGDAFNSGGRNHACFRVEGGGRIIAVEFGATALLGWKALKFKLDDLDAVVVSHLHGDHFGGLPFLLLDCHFAQRRTKPLIFAGPPGFKARLDATLEALYPGSSALDWHFPLHFTELVPQRTCDVAGFQIDVFEVDHPSGAPSYGMRVKQGGKVLAFSGDTCWVPALLKISAGADFFICECYSGAPKMSNHIDWPLLKTHLPEIKAKRIAITHMGETALPKAKDMTAAGLLPAHDGMVVDI